MFKRSNFEGYQAARQESSSGESEGEEETFLYADEQDPPEEEPGVGEDTGDVGVVMTAVHPAPVTEVWTGPALTDSPEQALSTSPQDEVTEVTSLDGPSNSQSNDIPMQTFTASPTQPGEGGRSALSIATTRPLMNDADAPPSYESLLFEEGAATSRGPSEADKGATEARGALQEAVPPSPTGAEPPLELSVITEGDEAEHPPVERRDSFLLAVSNEGDIDVENAQNEGLEATDNDDSTTPHEITFGHIRRPGVKTAVAVLVNTAIALFILLMALSIQKLDYYQVGLKMKRVSKYVFFMEEVFEGGRYVLGPSNVFKQYSSVAHSMDFPEVRIYTTDPLRISFHCHFHFFIKKTELGLLEDELDRYYLETVEKASISAIKNTASMYSIDEILEMRSVVEKRIHQNLQTELQGTCCLTKEQCRDFTSCHECYANATTDCIRGYHLEVPFFNLLSVELPDSVLARKRAVLITALGGEEEVYHQEAAVTRIETERMVQELLNEAALVSGNATAHANMIRAKAKAEARAIINTANSLGLTTLYRNLSVVEQDHKASIHWLRTLRYHQNLITGVDFEDYKRLMQERGG